MGQANPGRLIVAATRSPWAKAPRGMFRSTRPDSLSPTCSRASRPRAVDLSSFSITFHHLIQF